MAKQEVTEREKFELWAESQGCIDSWWLDEMYEAWLAAKQQASCEALADLHRLERSAAHCMTLQQVCVKFLNDVQKDIETLSQERDEVKDDYNEHVLFGLRLAHAMFLDAYVELCKENDSPASV